MSLKKSDSGIYPYSGVCWTGEIGFSRHIYSVTASGVYYDPAGTDVKVYARFGDSNEERFLGWGVPYAPSDPFSSLRLKVFLSSTDSSVSPRVSEICLAVKLQDRSEAGIRSRDNSRVSDLKRTREILDKYHEDFNHYPAVSIGLREKDRQWELLEDILSSASLTYYEDYDYGFIDQPTGVDDDYKYGYSTGGSGSYYLLWTKLEDVDSEQFNDSWTGKLLNLQCAAPIYCIYSGADADQEVLLKEFNENQGSESIEGAEFVKVKDDPMVWLKIQGHRVWIRTPELFEQAGGDWDGIMIKNTLADVPLLKFVKYKDKEEVYLVDEGLKRYVSNSRILGFYGQNSDIIVLDDERLINLLAETRLIRGKDLPEVYFLDQQIKRWVTSPEVFEKMGFNWNEIVEVDSRELDYYAEATPMF